MGCEGGGLGGLKIGGLDKGVEIKARGGRVGHSEQVSVETVKNVGFGIMGEHGVAILVI